MNWKVIVSIVSVVACVMVLGCKREAVEVKPLKESYRMDELYDFFECGYNESVREETDGTWTDAHNCYATTWICKQCSFRIVTCGTEKERDNWEYLRKKFPWTKRLPITREDGRETIKEHIREKHAEIYARIAQ